MAIGLCYVKKYQKELRRPIMKVIWKYYIKLKFIRTRIEKPKSPNSIELKNIVKPLFERLKDYKTLNDSNNRKLNNKSAHLADAILQSELFNFVSNSLKKGDGLYKDKMNRTQLVYYDGPNELVTRLNFLTSSKTVQKKLYKVEYTCTQSNNMKTLSNIADEYFLDESYISFQG
ncbi:Hypothetical protein CINCED_3A017454 [Cinara cedri]|uniref:Uncharacterized protein n=1 Tax=Cinara cedri TaxID=506608 RepID=A0A5E4M5A8_9HEMI|nr:Hypothetical protein CINCED_3A017454 [Cinara cedri]